MSKGSKQRPRQVSRQQYQDNWNAVFANGLRATKERPSGLDSVAALEMRGVLPPGSLQLELEAMCEAVAQPGGTPDLVRDGRTGRWFTNKG